MKTVFWTLLLFGPTLLAKDPRYERLVQNIQRVTLSITLHPNAADVVDPGGGLRAVLIRARDFPCEPHWRWPDGSPGSADARVSPMTMRQIVDTLERIGVLPRCEFYYSEAISDPKGPPPAKDHITSKFAQSHPTRTAWLILRTFDDDYHYYLITTVSWNESLKTVFAELRKTVARSPAEPLLIELQRVYERFK